MFSSNNMKLEQTQSTNTNGSASSSESKHRYEFNFPNCDLVDKYEKITRIGKGTFGEVFRAKNKQTRKEVALKRILMDNEQEGFPITALREIKILKGLKRARATNIVNLIEVCRSGEQVNGKSISYLVFDFCNHDLAGLIQEAHSHINKLPHIKCILKQLCEGVEAMHSRNIIHRDIKSSNILITKNGDLKIADFGLARPVTWKRKYTNRVVTLWYRPPELLLGERNYDGAIDMWGVGCIMAELFKGFPIMKGTSEINQLQLICQTVGPLTEDVWPSLRYLPLYQKMSKQWKDPSNQVKASVRVSHLCQDVHGRDLAKRLLALDPAKRIKAPNAVDHDFFWEDPKRSSNQDLAEALSSLASSSFEYTARKKQNGHHPSYAPNMVNRRNNLHRPIGHRPGTSTNNDGQYRDHVY